MKSKWSLDKIKNIKVFNNVNKLPMSNIVDNFLIIILKLKFIGMSNKINNNKNKTKER